MKRCFKCHCEKPLGDFYKHSAMKDGHLNKCKECTKKDVSAHRTANLESYRAYDIARSTLPHRQALRSRVAAEYFAEHPGRRKAYAAVQRAIQTGKLERWPCEICGDKAHAHHPHYGAPLLVTWLCPPHHKAAHAITRTTP